MSYQKWINNLTVGNFFDLQADKMPKQKALITPGQGDFTFKELKDISDLLARGMINLGVSNGDKVAVWAHNIPEWVFLFLGLNKIGAVMVPINTNMRTRDLLYYLKKAEVKVLFLINNLNSTDFLEILYKAIPDLQFLSSGEVQSEELPSLRRVILLGEENRRGFINFSDVLNGANKVNESDFHSLRERTSPFDTSIIKFTCGLTGYSRGAMLTNFGLINNAQPIARKLNLSSSDTLCLPVPFHYIFGFWLGLMVGFSTHTPIVSMTKYSALEVLKTIEEKRCTALYGVPTMFSDLLNHSEFRKFDLRSLRTGIMAGDFCPPDLIKQSIETMPIPELTVAYGITEVGVLTQTSWNEAMEKTLYTVGEPLDGMEMKIINPKNGEDLPPGEKGEICVKSPVIMVGYYNMPKETSEIMGQDGWFHTGDIGVRDKDGYYRITGRRRNMIIRGGENIYLLEAEKYLLTYPDIVDVRVVGIPSRRLGEEAYAFIQTNNGATFNLQAIREYFRDEICRHHLPRWINIVDELPGKKEGRIDRNELRRLAIEEIKSGEDHPLEIIYEG